MTSRRRLLGALGGLGAGVALPGTAAATDTQSVTDSDSPLQSNQSAERPLSGDSWPQYRGNPTNTAYQSDAVGPVDASMEWAFPLGIVDGLAVDDRNLYVTASGARVTARDRTDGTEQWWFRADSTIEYGPAVTGKTLYVATDSVVQAVDTTDGTERWRAETGETLGAAPAVTDGVVVAGSQDGVVIALDSADGTERWRVDIGGPVESSPVVTDSLACVVRPDGTDHARPLDDGTEAWQTTVGGSVGTAPVSVGDAIQVANTDGIVHSLDATDGTERWQFDTGEPIDIAPVADGETVYATTNRGDIHAIDASDGTRRWLSGSRENLHRAPAVADGTVYLPNDDYVYTFSAADGSETGRFSVGQQITASPAAADGVVFVGHSAGLTAKDADENDVWTVGRNEFRVWDKFVVADGSVYLPGPETLSEVDARTGAKRREIPIPTPLDSTPAVVDGTIYYTGKEGTLYAVELADGSVRWRVDSGGPITTEPTVVDGNVYVGDRRGYLRKIDASDGTERWSIGTGDFIDTAPAVADGTVYCGNNENGLYAVDAATRDFQRTEENVFDGYRATLTVADGTVYSLSGNRVKNGPKLFAFDAADGTEQWSVEMTGASAVAVGPESVFLDAEGRLYAVDKQTGEQQWVFSPDDQVTAPAVADGTVYVGATPRPYGSDVESTVTVYAVDADDGTETWRSQVTLSQVEEYDEDVSAPVVLDGLVLVGSKHRVFSFGGNPSTPTPTPTETDTPESSPTTGTDTGTPEGTDRTETAVGAGQTTATTPLPAWLSVAGVTGLAGYLAHRTTRDDD
ncbi:MAG: PQQ-binding-like beta-propeller repeat protein [Halobaculum sp.]